jgi:hypothetical protein
MSKRFAARVILAGAAALVEMSLGCHSSHEGSMTGPSTLGISAIAPSNGRPDLTTPIRIYGSAFQSGTKLTLDGVAVDSTFVDERTLTAIAPPHAAGSIDIVVTNPDGASSRLASGFAYVYPVAQLTVSGRLALEAIGESSQLTATAHFVDGSTKDVTRDIFWFMDPTPVAEISSAGILTARGLGSIFFFGRYTQLGKEWYWTGYVTVSPPGTFVVAGSIQEPGRGPLRDARVLNVTTGQSTLTDVGGEYSLAGQTSSHLAITKAGYEPVEIDATPNGYADTPMQPIVRLSVGAAPYSGSLAEDDMDFLVGPGTHCQPCRLIRVTSATSGKMQVRVNWGDPTAVLNVWVNGQAFPGSSGAREAVADTLTEAGEVVLYVGKIGDGSAHPDTGIHLPFTMTTTINGVEDMRPAQTWARPSGRPLTRLEHDRLAAARHW